MSSLAASVRPLRRFALDNRLAADHAAAELRADVLAGLVQPAGNKWMPPKWFYLGEGSDDFEAIATAVPEYYLGRAESEILRSRSDEIAALTRASTLIELGSGSSQKTHQLLTALTAKQSLRQLVLLDVSASALVGAGTHLVDAYPALAITALVDDYTAAIDLPQTSGPRLFCFLGSSIGNFTPAERALFLRRLRKSMAPGDHLLLGTDLVKAEKYLIPAYADAAGVTCRFNRNLLRVMNDILGADFDVEAFEHEVRWDPEREQINMFLRSSVDQIATVPCLDLKIPFAAGELLHTETCAKFRKEGVRTELSVAGLALEKWWEDERGRFGLSLAQAVGVAAD